MTAQHVTAQNWFFANNSGKPQQIRLKFYRHM